MSDNLTTPIANGTKLAFDEVVLAGETVKVARNKIGYGPDGEYTEVSAEDALPVRASSLPLPDGAATAAGMAEVKGALDKLIPQQWANRGASTNATHGTTGTRLVGILAVPLTKSPGKIRITDDPEQDADGMTIFEGGADSVSTLHPFMIPLGIKSHLGPWRVIFDADIRGIVLFD